MGKQNQTLTSEDLYNFLDNLDWKEIKKNPKANQYPHKILIHKGFEVFENVDDEDKFVIKKGDFKKYINSYQNTSVDTHKDDIVFAGWEDIIYFDTQTKKIKTQHTR